MAKKKTTPGELFLKKIAEAEASGKPVDLTMPPSIRDAINAELARAGRGPLKDREIIQGHLDVQDDRKFMEALEDTRWQPAMPVPNGQVPFAREIAEAEEAVRLAAYKKLSAEEKRLHDLKELSLKQMKEQASKEEHRKRLADPAVAESLAYLKALKDKVAFDPDWGFSDRLKLARAIEQLETPGADLQVGIEMTSTVRGVVAAKTQAIKDEYIKQRAALDQEIAQIDEAALDAGIATPAASPAPAGSARAKADAAFDAWSQAATSDLSQEARMPLWDAYCAAEVAAGKEAPQTAAAEA